ncbi:MAG: septum site-determining protein MinC [Halioglobus sp.]
MTDCCFQLKGSVFTAVVLELHRYSSAEFTRELEQKIEQAPQLLLQSPIVFNLDKCIDQAEEIDFAVLIQQCRALGLQPIGFRSCARFNQAMEATGLALLPPSSTRGGSAIQKPAQPVAGPEAIEKRVRVPSKIITQPVRSGQQIYARDCDLIVMSQVSEGAEVLADGNIHVYGGLRGRALAGVNGDETARIFCHSMEAELLSVAGNFILSEDFDPQLWKQSVQAYLNEEKLCINPL